MMRDFIFIFKHDLRHMLTRGEAILWVFVMPLVFFFLIGSITGGSGNGGATVETMLLHGSEQAGELSESLTRRLEDRGFTVKQAATPEAQARRTLYLPPQMSEKIANRQPVELRFQREGEGPARMHDQFRVARASYTMLADLWVAQELHGSTDAAAVTQVQQLPRHVFLDVSPAGARKEVPRGFAQAVPGTMVMFTLIILLTSGAVLLVVERRQGLLRRLASTPISRGSIVWGKWAARVVFGWVQIGFALIAGRFLFKVDWGTELPMLLVVLAIYSGLIAWFGMLAGTIAKTEGQAVGIGVLGANIMAALGGCWWPIEVVPSWMQRLADFLPTGWAMRALHSLVSFGQPPSSVLPQLATMIVVALAVAWFTVRRFRFE